MAFFCPKLFETNSPPGRNVSLFRRFSSPIGERIRSGALSVEKIGFQKRKQTDRRLPFESERAEFCPDRSFPWSVFGGSDLREGNKEPKTAEDGRRWPEIAGNSRGSDESEQPNGSSAD